MRPAPTFITLTKCIKSSKKKKIGVCVCVCVGVCMCVCVHVCVYGFVYVSERALSRAFFSARIKFNSCCSNQYQGVYFIFWKCLWKMCYIKWLVFCVCVYPCISCSMITTTDMIYLRVFEGSDNVLEVEELQMSFSNSGKCMDVCCV